MEPAFLPRSAVVVAELKPDDRACYIAMLAARDCELVRNVVSGGWVANLRVLAAGSASDESATERRAAEESAKKEAAVDPRTKLVREARLPPEQLFRSVEELVVGGVDCALYPRFASLVIKMRRTGRSKTTEPPKVKPLSWLMRLIEGVYDARYARDAAELEKGDFLGGGGEAACATRLFPVTLIDHVSKRYGLEKIVEHTCWDVLVTAHAHRAHHIEAEIFARFLQELYDPDDLLFFLYLRTVVQRVLGVALRHRWTTDALTGGPDRAPRLVWLSHRECVAVARMVFGDDDRDTMFAEFMETIDAHVVAGPAARGPRNAATDTRRIEVSHFLQLALVGYHETRPSDAAAPHGDGLEARTENDREERSEDGEAERHGQDVGEDDERSQPWSASPAREGADHTDHAESAALELALIERSCDAHMDAFEEQMTSLPNAVAAEIRCEVRAQIAAKLDTARLATAATEIERFLSSPEVRDEIAPLVQLLATFARERSSG